MATTQADLDREASEKRAANAEIDAKPETQESVGFWERIKAGNIDDESSEAYKRWNPKAKAAREAVDQGLKAGAEADKVPDAPAEVDKPVDKAANDIEEFRKTATNAFMDDKEPGWDTKSEPVAAPKPVVHKPVVKPAAPVASVVKAPVAKAPMATPEVDPGLPMITKPSANDRFQADGQVKGAPAKPATKPAVAAPKAERQVMRINPDELGKNNAFMGGAK